MTETSKPPEGRGSRPHPHDASALQRRDEVFNGRIVRLSIDHVRFPDGSTGQLELIRHPGASCVLPIFGSIHHPDPDVMLLRQYRYAGGGFMYEVPAGIPSGPDESWESCAHRELEEETGFRAGTLHPLTRIYTTPGFTDEVIHLFAATDLSPGDIARDEDEFIEVMRMPFSATLDLIRSGQLIDAKSLACLLFAHEFLLEAR